MPSPQERERMILEEPSSTQKALQEALEGKLKTLTNKVKEEETQILLTKLHLSHDDVKGVMNSISNYICGTPNYERMADQLNEIVAQRLRDK